MNDAVFNELGSKSQQMYFKCPSADMAGLGSDDPILDQAQAISQLPPKQQWNYPAVADDTGGAPALTPDMFPMQQSLTTPPSQRTPFDPYALQKLVNPNFVPPSDSGYTYHTPPGQFMGPPAPPAPSTPWSKTLVDVLDTTVKAGAPAATAYINYTAAQQAMRNQPVRIPGSTNVILPGRTSYAPWVVGGLVIAGLLVGLTVLSAKK